MTDQNQNTNPNTVNQNDESFDIFGGSDDIFENSAVLEPIKDTLEWEERQENRELGNPEPAIETNTNNVSNTNNDFYDLDQNWNNGQNTEEKVVDFENEVVDPYENASQTDVFEEINPMEESSQNDFFEEVNPVGLEEWNETSSADTQERETDYEFAEVNPYENIENNEEEKEDFFDLWDDVLEPIQEIDETNNFENEVVDPFENASQTDVLDEIEPIDEITETPSTGEEEKETDYEFEEVNPYESMENQEEKEDVLDLEDDVLEPIEEIDENVNLEEPNIQTEFEEDFQEEGENTEEEEESDFEDDFDDDFDDEEGDIEDTVEEEQEEDSEEEEEDPELQEARTRETRVEIDEDATDLQKKFYELVREIKTAHELVDKDLSQWFDVLWWNDDRKKTMYKAFAWDNFASIDKTESFKEETREEVNTLTFILENKSLQVLINDELLYDELEDLVNDQPKTLQTLEKLNKFIFLISEECKKIEKIKKEKEQKSKIKWIFRNF